MENKSRFIDKILKNRPLSHVVFWLIMLLLLSQIFLYSGQSFFASIVFVLAIFPAMLLAAYTLVYYQIPKLAFNGKYFLFVLSLLISSYVYTVLARILTVYVAEPLVLGVEAMPDPDFFLVVLGSFDRLLKNYLVSVYIAASIMAIIKLIKLRSEESIGWERLEREKATSELNFLKAQIHPHFLLNTLNNLYALTIKKSEKAPETVLKLSEMLSYVLYKCNEKYVLLQDEITLIENYIALEELRYGSELKLKFSHNLTNNNYKIAPLILLSLVENAFKHGVSGDVNQPEIKIDLKAMDGQLMFEVFNTKNPNKQLDPNNYTKGIGSKNVKKQLDLLYSNEYALNVLEEKETYTVKLTLPVYD